MVIFADHLEVPSSTLCLAAFVCCTKSSLEIWNISWMTSNTSGLFRSLIFILSFMAVMMVRVLSSAPCFELFSAAPAIENQRLCGLTEVTLWRFKRRGTSIRDVVFRSWDRYSVKYQENESLHWEQLVLISALGNWVNFCHPSSHNTGINNEFYK